MRRVEEFLAEQVAIRGAEPALSDSIGTHWTFDEFDRASDDVAKVLR